jgi:uncharacterized membrane protein HdeD (DUF308 family)
MATVTDSVRSDFASTTLGERWGWLLALGIVQLIAGSIAIAAPALASLAAVLIFGVVLLTSAIFHLVHAFKTRKWPGTFWYVLGGFLYAAAGVLVLLFPLGGALTLAVVIATLLIGDGVLRALVASTLRPQEGWGWWLAAGIASVLLGVTLFMGWPATAIWAIGLLLGINLMFSGATNAALAIASRSSGRRAA